MNEPITHMVDTTIDIIDMILIESMFETTEQSLPVPTLGAWYIIIKFLNGIFPESFNVEKAGTFKTEHTRQY